MPTYEYACKACGEHLEVVQSFKDEPLTTCPACDGPLRKVFGSIGISFKGSGFYRTDNRSAPPKKEKAAEASSAPGEKSEKSSSGEKASPNTAGAASAAKADKAGNDKHGKAGVAKAAASA